MGLRHTRFGWWKDQQGDVINGETLTVYLSGTTTVATIYAASAGGSAISGGAITLSNVGFFQYWVDEDDYATTQRFKHVFTGAKFDTLTTDPVVIFPGITASSSDTLTNKTISTDDNTITINEADIQNLGTAIALIADNLSVFAATTSLQLLGVISDETGSGSLVFGTSPALATPTVSSAVLNTAVSGTAVLDEDDMSSDSNTKIATQQSIKAYVDSKIEYIRLHDSKATTTDGGTFTTGAWQKRTVTEDQDTGSNVSVASSVIVLSAGTYDCLITCPASQIDNHQARLRNTTGGSTILVGSNANIQSTNTNANNSVIRGRFTIAASQNIEIQHRCETTRSTDGFGEANSFGENEVYTVAEFWKVS